MGSIASLLVLMSFSPPSTSLAGYALIRGAIADIATWIFFPSFALTLVAGMLAIAVNRAFHDAGWAWVKLATGILVFAGSFQVLGSIQEEAKRTAGALAGQLDAETITGSFGEQSALSRPRMSCLASGGRASRGPADIGKNQRSRPDPVTSS
jgi:hypothetical protein